MIRRLRAWWQAVLDRLEAFGVSENAVLLVFAVVIGLGGALGVILFYRLIDLAYRGLYIWSYDLMPGLQLLAYRPFLTALGLVLAWYVMRRMAPGEDGLTVPDVQRRVVRQSGEIPVRPVVARTAASALTIGGGGSAGSEGPVAVLGATIGSGLARLFRFSPDRVTVLVGAGTAAGISAAFNAPLAGAFFALEEILGSFSVAAFPPVVVASVIAAVVSRAVFGNHPAFPIPEEYGWSLAREVLVFYPLLGILAGLVAVAFTRFHFRTGDLVDRLRVPPILLPAAAGLIVGSLVVVSGGLLAGSGHIAFPIEVFGRMAWYALALLALAKIVATSLTLQAGGSGGLFTPSLFVGAATGGALGALLVQLFPELGLHAEAYALVGMGAVVAAATGAPLTGILLVFEMTGDYAIMLPLMLTVAIATVVARRMERDNLYSGWLARKGERIEHGARRDVLAGMRVADVYEPPVAVVVSTEPLASVLGRLDDTDQDAFPVVDAQGILTGMIGVTDLARLVRDGQAVVDRTAADMVTATETVTPNDSLLLAIRRMGIRGAGLLPVVEPGTGRLLGVVSRAHVLTVYGRTSITGSHPAVDGRRD